MSVGWGQDCDENMFWNDCGLPLIALGFVIKYWSGKCCTSTCSEPNSSSDSE